MRDREELLAEWRSWASSIGLSPYEERELIRAIRPELEDQTEAIVNDFMEAIDGTL